MLDFINTFFKKRKEKRSFQEYGYDVKTFEIDNIGTVQYAQWKHPFEQQKSITKSNVNFYKTLAKPGAMIIDIGAHTGDTTVPMALAVGKQGLVLGLEPNKYVFKILEKNVSLNPEHTNIVPLCFAATEADGDFVFNYSDASFCNGGFLSEIEMKNHKHDYTLTVTGKNLEKYLFANYTNELSKLELIKVDAEGYDKEILKTIPNILKQFRPNIMVECFKKLNVKEREELFDVIDAFDYHLFRLANFEENGEMVQIMKHNMMDEKHFEMLAIPKEKA